MKPISPMLAGWTGAPDVGDDFHAAMDRELPRYRDGGWTFELKWDGFRLQAIKVGEDVRILFGRSANDVTPDFPEFVAAMKLIPVDCIIDGEAVMLRNGWPHFQDFQNRGAFTAAEKAERLRFIAFDVMQFGTVNAMTAPYADRRKALEALVAPASPVIILGPTSTDGKKMWDFVLEHRLEGLIAKPLNSRYLPGERGTWRKVKRLVTEDFVVVAYTPSTTGKRAGWFGSLYMAQPVEGGQLRMVGPVGTGFNDAMLADTTAQLKLIERTTPPENLRKDGQPSGVERERMVYVEPVIWAKVCYAERTDDGWALRGPASWKGQIPGLTMKPEDYTLAPPPAGSKGGTVTEVPSSNLPSDEIPADDRPVIETAARVRANQLAAGRQTAVERVGGQVFEVPGSSGMRRVSVVAAGGRKYLTCDCTAGRFVWKGKTFNPCKHMRMVLSDQLAGVTLENGLFS